MSSKVRVIAACAAVLCSLALFQNCGGGFKAMDPSSTVSGNKSESEQLNDIAGGKKKQNTGGTVQPIENDPPPPDQPEEDNSGLIMEIPVSREEVQEYLTKLLGKAPSAELVDYCYQQLSDGKSITEIAAVAVQMPEVQTLVRNLACQYFNSCDDQTFKDSITQLLAVTDLNQVLEALDAQMTATISAYFRTLMGRNPTDQELAYWKLQAKTQTKEQILALIAAAVPAPSVTLPEVTTPASPVVDPGTLAFLGVKNSGSIGYLSSVIDSSGNIYVSGWSTEVAGNFSTSSMVLIKYLPSGAIAWSKKFGDGKLVKAKLNQTILTTDGNLLAVGSVAMKIKASDGSLIWTKTYRNNSKKTDELMAAQELPDGGFIMSGGMYENKSNVFGTKALVMRTDAQGNVLWAKIYGQAFFNFFDRLLLSTEDGIQYFVATGAFSGNGLGRQAAIFKFGLDGTLIWSKKLGPDYSAIRGIVPGPGGNSYLLSYQSGLPLDTKLTKLAYDGTVLASLSLAVARDDWSAGLTRLSDGSYGVSGGTSYGIGSGDHQYKLRLTKLSADLSTVVWNRLYAPPDRQVIVESSVNERSGGGLAVAFRSTVADEESGHLLLTDSSGKSTSNCSAEQPETQGLSSVKLLAGSYVPTIATTASPAVSTKNPLVGDLSYSTANVCGGN